MEGNEYEILEVHYTYENGLLISVAVLWKRYGEVRSSYSDLKKSVGYHYLKNYDVIGTLNHFIDVAKNGRKLSDKEKKRYFPKQKIA